MTRSLNIALLGYGAVAGYVAEHADSLEGVKVRTVGHACKRYKRIQEPEFKIQKKESP